MYFTSGQDRAFERLMQEKPGFDHYDGGGANAPEDCGSCRFYRPDWKYQYCVYAECPYQPGKLTALAAVKFTVKGADDDMAVFRVEKNKGYTVMSNHHLRNKALSLKAKGLLSQMLSLPEDWDYTLKGLSLINRESIDAIRTAVWELERAGYIRREQGRDAKGKMADMVYTIYEQPVLDIREQQARGNRRFSAGNFYAFRTPLRWQRDKEYRRPSDYAGKALKFQAFSGPKCVGWMLCCDMLHSYGVLFIFCWLLSASRGIIM